MISARPPEMRSMVAKSWKTRTGTSELKTVTDLGSDVGEGVETKFHDRFLSGRAPPLTWLAVGRPRAHQTLPRAFRGCGRDSRPATRGEKRVIRYEGLPGSPWPSPAWGRTPRRAPCTTPRPSVPPRYHRTVSKSGRGLVAPRAWWCGTTPCAGKSTSISWVPQADIAYRLCSKF